MVTYALAALAALLVAWFLMELKTSRPDGTLLRVHPYRRIMFYLMPSRNESVVYFDAYLDATALLAYLERAKDRIGANMTHATVAAAGIGLSATPQMNRFVAGYRLYERKGKWITFSMKRKKLDRQAKIGTVKVEIRDEETFAGFCARVNAGIGEERSGKRTSGDKELDFFNALPRPLLAGAARLIRAAQHYNLLPGAFIAGDPMHTSVFVANLGSLDMAAGYHHLFEYGTCPLFMMVGKVEDAPMVHEGRVEVRPRLHLRFSYDERIDDGLNARFGIEAAKRVLEDPDRFLGCLGEDGSDTRPMWPRDDWDEDAIKPRVTA